MSGLLCKDLCFVMKRKQSLIMFILIALIMSASIGKSAFIVAYICLLFVMLATGTLSYDETENGLTFLMTLPVDRKTYVQEKYVLAGVFGAVSWIFGTLLSFVMEAVKTGAFSMAGLEEMATMIPVCILFIAFTLPTQLKFGIEKSRTVLVAVYGGAIAVVFVLLKILENQGITVNEIMGRLPKLPNTVLIAIVAVVVVALSFLSYNISLKVMKNKKL